MIRKQNKVKVLPHSASDILNTTTTTFDSAKTTSGFKVVPLITEKI